LIPKLDTLGHERRLVKLSSVQTRAIADPDDDPGALAQAIDQVLDEINDAITAQQMDEALALLTAASAVADALLEAMGLTDADELTPAEMPMYAAKLAVEKRKLEKRAAAPADGSIPFIGHAAVFDTPALIEGWDGDFMEQTARGAFRKTIQEADVRLLLNHDPNYVLDRNRNGGTLRLGEDQTGLLTEANIPPTSYGQDVALLLRKGIVSQMSYAFEVLDEELDYTGDVPLRTIKEVRLGDVSIVTYPAFTSTDAQLRSAGFELLCRSMDLGKSDQQDFLKHLIEGHKDPEFKPSLEAAGKALQALARRDEPAVSHSDVLAMRSVLIEKRLLKTA